MKQMKSRMLMASAAALLAGTAMAAGQGSPDRKEGGSGAQQPGISQSQPKGKQQVQQREERGGQAQRDQSKPSTTGQAPQGEEKNRAQGQNPRGEEQNRTQGQSQRDPEQNRAESPSQRNQDQKSTQGQNQRDQEQNRTQGRAEQGERANGGTSSTTLTTEQRTKLRQTVIEGGNAPKVGKVDFSVTEGTVIPKSVHIVTVPQTIVELHPEWRGYRYFVYNDEIIIVEPDTLKIVAIVEV